MGIRRLSGFKLLSVLPLWMLAAATSFAQSHYKELSYPELRNIVIPKVERITLSNGIKLFLLEDHELPLIHVSAQIRVGSIYEPADKIGLAATAGTVMRSGGTTTRTGDEIDKELERIAASVETGIGLASGFASMSVLKEDLDIGLSILADVLMNPAFPEDKIELAKVQQRTAISRRNDRVEDIARREFFKLIYGPESAWARYPEYSTIEAITRDDLVNFHHRFYHPSNVMLGVWGDCNAQIVAQKIEKVFVNWKEREIESLPKPEIQYDFRSTTHLVSKDDVNQTTVYLGHIGGLRNDPDYFSLIVMNRILGTSSTSRLFKNVRARQGLAYSVFGHYSANYDHPGVFIVGCQTKSETTIKAIRALKEEIEKMTEVEVTGEELASAKESYLNSFVFNFDTKGEIIRRLMTYEYYGYPVEFLQTTKEKVEQVSVADVLRVARKHLDPNKLQILAVGRPQDFDYPLSILGPVHDIDITIPSPSVSKESKEATLENLTKGRESLEKAIVACGGIKAFKEIKTLRWKGHFITQTPQGTVSMAVQLTVAPQNRLRVEIRTPMGQVAQVMNGDRAWIISPQGSQLAPANMKKEMKARLWRGLAYLFSRGDSQLLSAQYLGREKVQEILSEVLLITPEDGTGFRLYLQAETMMPLKMRYQSMNLMGELVTSEEIFSDFRPVGRVKLPFKSVIYQSGQKAQEVTGVEILTNVEVDLNKFTVP